MIHLVITWSEILWLAFKFQDKMCTYLCVFHNFFFLLVYIIAIPFFPPFLPNSPKYFPLVSFKFLNTFLLIIVTYIDLYCIYIHKHILLSFYIVTCIF